MFGNLFGIVDGFVLVLIGLKVKGDELGLKFCGWIFVIVIMSMDLIIMLMGLVFVFDKVLKKVGLIYEDIDLFEVNEVFVFVVMWFMCEIGVLFEKINVNGGFIVLGYLLGVIGVMILGMVLDELECRNLK